MEKIFKFKKHIAIVVSVIVVALVVIIFIFGGRRSQDFAGNVLAELSLPISPPTFGIIPNMVSDSRETSLPEVDFEFEIVAENELAVLLLDRRNNNLRVVDRETGRYFDTLVFNGQDGSQFTRDLQRTDFTLTLLRDRYDNVGMTLSSLHDSVLRNQVEYFFINGGISATFLIGDPDAVTLSMFPRMISHERMHYHVFQHLDQSTIAAILERDYFRMEEYYIRLIDTFDVDGELNAIPLPTQRRLYGAFYETGTYTFDELAYDNVVWGYEYGFRPAELETLVIEYTLDGRDLIVNIPRSGWGYNARPFRSITLNPYLLSGSVYDEGYILIPCGSGGIIQFNNGRTMDIVNMPVFGIDPLATGWAYPEPFEQATLPIFGMVRNDIGILAIIEEGAAVATIHANVSDRIDEFNRVFASFDMIFQQGVLLRGGAGGLASSFTFDDVYQTDIRMRYVFLTGDDASYMGMARAYQNFLLENNKLNTNPIPDDIPMFVNFLASTPHRAVRLGVPYTRHEPMTTTADAENILRQMHNMGIQNVFAEYSFWGNQGMIAGRMHNTNVLRSIGGNRGMRSLNETANELNFQVFPSQRTVAFTDWIPRFGRINNTMLTRTINHMVGTETQRDVSLRVFRWTYPLLSPHYWNEYNLLVAENINRFGIDNISSVDLGRTLFGDYSQRGRNAQISRTEAVVFASETLENLSNEMNVMLSNPNSFALAHANVITDLPFGLGSRRIVDFYIPFKQMVLENHIPFSMPAFNIDPMDWRGFDEYMLRAVESRSAPKLILTNEPENAFMVSFYHFQIVEQMYFQTMFSRWEDRLGEYYERLNNFFHTVRGAYIINHRVYARGDNVIVEYSNGVVVYLNYGRTPWEIDGMTIDILDFRVVQS